MPYYYFNELGHPFTGLYFILNGTTYQPGDSVLISDIGSQPVDNHSDPGSTLVCVTTNVKNACCRSADTNNTTNATAGVAGEWYYPDGTPVPRPDGGNVVDFVRVGFTLHLRLARQISTSTPPLGVYTCQVPDPSTGFVYSASITIYQERSQ